MWCGAWRRRELICYIKSKLSPLLSSAYCNCFTSASRSSSELCPFSCSTASWCVITFRFSSGAIKPWASFTSSWVETQYLALQVLWARSPLWAPRLSFLTPLMVTSWRPWISARVWIGGFAESRWRRSCAWMPWGVYTIASEDPPSVWFSIQSPMPRLNVIRIAEWKYNASVLVTSLEIPSHLGNGFSDVAVQSRFFSAKIGVSCTDWKCSQDLIEFAATFVANTGVSGWIWRSVSLLQWSVNSCEMITASMKDCAKLSSCGPHLVIL